MTNVPDQIIQRHPDDDTVCPAYTWPHQGACDRIGSGVHASMYEFSDLTDLVEFFHGTIDIQHLVDECEVRRIPPDHGFAVTKRTLVVEIAKQHQYILGPPGTAKGL